MISRLAHGSRDHRKIILYAAPGKDTFYLKLGFRRMTTAMAEWMVAYNVKSRYLKKP